MKIPRKVEVWRDRNEQRVLPFPKTLTWYHDGKESLIQVAVVGKKLDAGDYTLAGWDDLVGIETKRRGAELYQNTMTDDAGRAGRALQRFVEAYEFPYVLLECPVPDIYSATAWVDNPAPGVQRFLQECVSLGIRVMFAGTTRSTAARRKLGQFVLTLMLSHALQQEYGPINVLEIVDRLKKENDSGHQEP